MKLALIGCALFVTTLMPQLAHADDPEGQAEQEAAPTVEGDLAALQGKWETTLRSGGQKIHNVQTIRDTTSTVERFDENGRLLQRHTASFKLDIQQRVRIFTFFDLRVTAGPQKGRGFKGPRSFVYVLQPDTWIEARGLLVDQPEGAPRLMTWTRLPREKVANRSPAGELTVSEPR